MERRFKNQYKSYLKRKDSPEYKVMQYRANAAYRKRVRHSIFEMLGGPVCRRCGFDDLRALQIDHTGGGGSKERKIHAKKYLLLIAKDTSRYQVLCANCNWIKREENNEINNQYECVVIKEDGSESWWS